jgi:hypothetical protein
MTQQQELIAIDVKRALAQGRFYTVSKSAIYPERAIHGWVMEIADECGSDVSEVLRGSAFVFTAKEQMPIEDVSFRAGFEAAKNAAIQCARQSEHWNLFEARGCKAVQHSIEFMQMLDATRFNHDGTMKPEPTVEYDREKHGPIVNGKVDLGRMKR